MLRLFFVATVESSSREAAIQVLHAMQTCPWYTMTSVTRLMKGGESRSREA